MLYSALDNSPTKAYYSPTTRHAAGQRFMAQTTRLLRTGADHIACCFCLNTLSGNVTTTQ